MNVANEEGGRPDDVLLEAGNQSSKHLDIMKPSVDVKKEEPRGPSLFEQGCAALFYAVSSLLVIFVNKVSVSLLFERRLQASLHCSWS